MLSVTGTFNISQSEAAFNTGSCRQQNPLQTETCVLLAARKVHSPHEYRLMSAPILLELQQREQDILAYLSRTETEAVRG